MTAEHTCPCCGHVVPEPELAEGQELLYRIPSTEDRDFLRSLYRVDAPEDLDVEVQFPSGFYVTWRELRTQRRAHFRWIIRRARES